MSNFTEEIKNEITSMTVSDLVNARAFFAAFIRTSGSIISRNGYFGFELVTENERTAEYVLNLTEEKFDIRLNVSEAKFDALSGRDKLAFECVDTQTDRILRELKIVDEDKDGTFINFGLDEKLLINDESKRNYIKGAFLGGGSCTLPEDDVLSRTGYHFEIVFSNKLTAYGFCELLCEFEILAKLVNRKDKWVAYIKSKAVISDIMNVLGCANCLDKLNIIMEIKERTNNENRVNNCSVSNIDKTVTASVNQVKSIEIIAQTIGLQSLDKNLFDVAECRLADKNASMQELAERLKISKSCLNHRMRKLSEIAASLTD